MGSNFSNILHKKFLLYLPLLAIGFILALSDIPASGDPGSGWHLKFGEIFLSAPHIPQIDPFLMEESSRWIHNQWLGDVIFAAVAKVAGIKGVEGLTLSLCLLSIFLLSKKEGTLLHLLIITLSLYSVSLQWSTRPVTFSFLFFSLWLLLLKRQDGWESFIFSFLLFALWSNIHPAFTFGAFIGGVFFLIYPGFSAGLKLSGAVLGSLINPYGVSVWKEALLLGRSSFFMGLNSEWHSITFEWIFVPFVILSLLFFFSFVFGKLSWKEMVIPLLVIVLAFSTRRFIPFASLSILWSLKKNWEVSSMRVVLASVFILLSLPAARSFSNSKGLVPPYGKGIDQAVEDSISEGENCYIFNHPNWGGYITYRHFPRCRPYIDDRNEVNGEQKYRDFIAMERGDISIDSTPFTHAIVRSGKGVAASLENSPFWVKKGENEEVILFIRNSPVN